MPPIRNHLKFLLNDTEIRLDDCGPNDMLLDFLRLNRHLTGTKEGCAEGDCGACTILVGRLHDGGLRYEAVNACIRLMASLDSCHVVTIEHLRGADGGLHPVQRAMVEADATQCGFCTPGFVMAIYALWMETPHPTRGQVTTSLQGNLCRCTGYRPIIDAAMHVGASPAGDALLVERDATIARLSAMRDGARVVLNGATVPADEDDLAALLAEIPKPTIVAGATDVGLWITKHMKDIAPAIFINHLMKSVEVTDGMIRIGAGVTYSEFAPRVAEYLPDVVDYWSRIGGWQVRNAGTIGGNIANGSPIGETPPLLIALDARLVLRKGAATRTIPLDSYFIEYGKQDRAPGEFVAAIEIPRVDALIGAYKVSKRRESDITAVAMAIRVIRDGDVITDARIAFGGMAGTPKRSASAEAALIGQPFAEASFEAAAAAVARDYQPLSDWRASSDYRRITAGNLIRRFWLEQSGATARLEHAS